MGQVIGTAQIAQHLASRRPPLLIAAAIQTHPPTLGFHQRHPMTIALPVLFLLQRFGFSGSICKQHPIGHVLPPPTAEALLPQEIPPAQAREHGPDQLVLGSGFVGLVVMGKTLHNLP